MRLANCHFCAQHELGMAMADLPSGTITFLFTANEGSTARWEWDRQAMAAAVQRRLALRDPTIQDHGGVHFKIVGDAIQATFPTAPTVVGAALDALRALLAEECGSIDPLRVRTAVDVGEATSDAHGDSRAPAPNRLSRLLAFTESHTAP
jgi:class 3 adenylate cyclase